MIKPRKPINTLTQTVQELKIVEALHPRERYRSEARRILRKLAKIAKLEAYQQEFFANFVDEHKIEQELHDKLDAEYDAQKDYELYENNVTEFHEYHCKLDDGEIPFHMSFESYLASIYTNYDKSIPSTETTPWNDLEPSESTKQIINELFALNPIFKELGIELEMV